MRYLRWLLGVIGLLALVGCGKNFVPKSEIYEGGGTVAVLWESPEHAQSFVIESGGLTGVLAQAVSESQDYLDALESIKVYPIANDHYLDPYGKALEDKGMTVSLVRLPVDSAKLREKSKAKKKKAPYDFTYLKAEKNIDFVLFLDISSFGVQKHTAMGAKLGRPSSKLKFSLYLVDTHDNGVLGRYNFHKLEKLSDGWKDEEYKVLKEDVKALLIEGLQDAYMGFFES